MLPSNGRRIITKTQRIWLFPENSPFKTSTSVQRGNDKTHIIGSKERISGIPKPNILSSKKMNFPNFLSERHEKSLTILFNRQVRFDYILQIENIMPYSMPRMKLTFSGMAYRFARRVFFAICFLSDHAKSL